MALITSRMKEQRMSIEVAKHDITEVNELGQTVVIAAKGQPIPEGYKPAAKAVAAPAENKARPAPQKR